MKIMVAEFEMAPGLRDNVNSVRGWWFGARNIRQNPRAGLMFAEQLTANLAQLEFVNLWTPMDLKYYFAERRASLQASYDYLSEEEIDTIMRDVPKIEFARHLGADKLIEGRIIENYLSENRTVHIWSSYLHVQCRVVDGLTGNIEWEKEYYLKKRFASQLSVQDEVARLVVEDLKETYFRPMTILAGR